MIVNETTDLSPDENALDSLQRLEKELGPGSPQSVTGLKGVLCWAWHAVVLLAHRRLMAGRESFDAWMQEYLQPGEPDLLVERDMHRDASRRLDLVELIDMLSDVDLPILKPEFYQGWQDRTSRCHELRRRVREIMGKSIGKDQREELLLLTAAYNRLLHVPVPLGFPAGPAWRALPALFDLLEMLVEEHAPGADSMNRILAACRSRLPGVP